MITRKIDGSKNPVAFVFFNAKTRNLTGVSKSSFLAEVPVKSDGASMEEAMDAFENSEMGISGYVSGSAEPYLLVLPDGKVATGLAAR